MAFDIIYLKKTGQIVRNGYFGDSLVLAKDEDKITFDDWVDFADKAVNVRTRTLVVASDRNRYAFRGPVGDPWEAARTKRDDLLTKTDYMMMPDYPISEEHRANLAAYRQALRDITKQTDPTNILWPVFPEK